METKSTKGPATRRPACYQVTLSAAKYRIAGEVRYNPMFEITPDDISPHRRRRSSHSGRPPLRGRSEKAWITDFDGGLTEETRTRRTEVLTFV